MVSSVVVRCPWLFLSRCVKSIESTGGGRLRLQLVEAQAGPGGGRCCEGVGKGEGWERRVGGGGGRGACNKEGGQTEFCASNTIYKYE